MTHRQAPARAAIGSFVFFGSIASCAYAGSGNCLNIRSWPNGIINLAGHVADAGNGGIKYQDPTAILSIASDTYIDNNKNYGIESTALSPKISFVTPVLYSNMTADFNSNVLTSTQPIYSKQYPCSIGFQFGGAATGMTYRTQKCVYALRGFFVDLTYQLCLSKLGSSTGAATLAQLPVAGTAVRDAGGSPPAYAANFSSVTSPIQSHVGAGNVYADIYSFNSSGQFVLSNRNFSASAALAGTLSYLRSGAN